MNNIEIEARAYILKFMTPIDALHKYPMCFDTAKQCAIIAIDEIMWNCDNLKTHNHFKELKAKIQRL